MVSGNSMSEASQETTIKLDVANLDMDNPSSSSQDVVAQNDVLISKFGVAVARKKPFMIGVAGGTASGKSTVCERIIDGVIAINNFPDRKVISLSQDSFYRELTKEESKQAQKGMFNFDHPDAFDKELLVTCLNGIRNGKKVSIPIYDFKTNSRRPNEFREIQPSDVVLLEGILIFYYQDIRDMFDMRLFVDTDADTRLARRVLRDIEERGRDLEQILLQYSKLVKPAFEEFCLPTKKFADVIIPRGAENTVAIDLIVQHICDYLSLAATHHLTNNNEEMHRRSSIQQGSIGGRPVHTPPPLMVRATRIRTESGEYRPH